MMDNSWTGTSTRYFYLSERKGIAKRKKPKRKEKTLWEEILFQCRLRPHSVLYPCDAYYFSPGQVSVVSTIPPIKFKTKYVYKGKKKSTSKKKLPPPSKSPSRKFPSPKFPSPKFPSPDNPLPSIPLPKSPSRKMLPSRPIPILKLTAKKALKRIKKKVKRESPKRSEKRTKMHKPTEKPFEIVYEKKGKKIKTMIKVESESKDEQEQEHETSQTFEILQEYGLDKSEESQKKKSIQEQKTIEKQKSSEKHGPLIEYESSEMHHSFLPEKHESEKTEIYKKVQGFFEKTRLSPIPLKYQKPIFNVSFKGIATSTPVLMSSKRELKTSYLCNQETQTYISILTSSESESGSFDSESIIVKKRFKSK